MEGDMASSNVERNRASQERLRTMVERLSDDELMRELPDGWTVADALGHLAFYDRRAAILLRRFAQEGVFASPYDYDTINEALLHFTRRMPPRAVAEEALAAAEAADEAAAMTPEALISEIRSMGQVKLDRAEHRENHLSDIEALLS
jgi:uncharacterized damage-inducible protein DinB